MRDVQSTTDAPVLRVWHGRWCEHISFLHLQLLARIVICVIEQTLFLLVHRPGKHLGNCSAAALEQHAGMHEASWLCRRWTVFNHSSHLINGLERCWYGRISDTRKLKRAKTGIRVPSERSCAEHRFTLERAQTAIFLQSSPCANDHFPSLKLANIHRLY